MLPSSTLFTVASFPMVVYDLILHIPPLHVEVVPRPAGGTSTVVEQLTLLIQLRSRVQIQPLLLGQGEIKCLKLFPKLDQRNSTL
jgi:hypothetical protein